MRAFWSLLLLAITASPSLRADSCGALFSQVNLDNLPAGLRALVSAGTFQERVLTYVEDAEFVKFYDQIEVTAGNTLEKRTPEEIVAILAGKDSSITATLARPGGLTVKASTLSVGGGSVQILFQVDNLGSNSAKDLLELQTMQAAVIQKLFAKYDEKTLNEVSIRWTFKNQQKSMGEAISQYVDDAEKTYSKRCNWWKKSKWFLAVGGGGSVGTSVGAGTGWVAGMFQTDTDVDPGNSLILDTAVGGVLGGFGGSALTYWRYTIACGKSKIAERETYGLSFKRVVASAEKTPEKTVEKPAENPAVSTQ